MHTAKLFSLGGGYGSVSPILGILIFAAIIVIGVLIVVRRRR